MGIRHFSGLCSIISFIVIIAGMSVSEAHAGFDFGQPQASAIPSVTYKAGAPAPEKQQPLLLSNDKLADKSASQSESPAFEIYQERYVPDAVKKKYGLNDDWYGNNKPQSLVPEKMVSPPLKSQLAEAKQSGSVMLPPPLFARIPKEMLRELKQVSTTAPTDVSGDVAAAIEPATGIAGAVVVEGQPRNYTQSWRARKGENFRDVLRRWSERENTELMWASPDNPIIAKDFSFFGKYQDAVARLMATNVGGALHSQYRSEGLAPTMMTPASIVTTNNVQVEQPAAPMPLIESPLNNRTAAQQQERVPNSSQPFIPAPQKISTETRWLGLTGAPMSEVLKVWSEDAGVALVWQAERDYAMRSSVSKVGTYEEAVYAVLSQYNDSPVRPVGEMYRDPSTGQSYLIVRDDAGQ